MADNDSTSTDETTIAGTGQDDVVSEVPAFSEDSSIPADDEEDTPGAEPVEEATAEPEARPEPEP
ncbi:MAG TPA: hypothetical protein VGB58_06655, partial [Blastococcus sp.]